MSTPTIAEDRDKLSGFGAYRTGLNHTDRVLDQLSRIARRRLDDVERLGDDCAALLALVVGHWPAGGWCATLPWRRGGYPGGEVQGDMSGTLWYWFDRREDAEAAALEAGREIATRTSPKEGTPDVSHH